MADGKKTHPICPKCGYDQSGEVATWGSACPIDGVCPECGLGFAWADVFDPTRKSLPWYAEHAGSTLGMLGRSPGTLMRLLLPLVYWRLVEVSQRVALRRLTIWVVMMSVLLHLLMSIPYGYYNWIAIDQWNLGSPASAYQGYGARGVLAMLSNSVFSPVMHFYVTPQGLRPVFLGSGPRWAPSLYDMFVGFLLAAGFATLWAVVLLAVPVTRKLAKIRGPHIMRAYVLSVFMGVVMFEASRVEGIHFLVASVTPSGLFTIVIFACIIWLMLFWISAIRVGWRVRPSWLLVVLGTIAALLGMVVFVAVPSLYWVN